MIHSEEKHHIVLTDLRLAPTALYVILRDHLRDDHAAPELAHSVEVAGEVASASPQTLVAAHDVLHALDEYEEREGVRL